MNRVKNIETSEAGGHITVFDCGCAETIASECGLSSGLETGGILLGKRIVSAGRDIFVIRVTSGPGKRSVRRPTSFAPDMDHYNGLLLRHARESGYEYLGEWHKHPKGFETTSFTDLGQARKIFAEEGRDYMICPIVIEKKGMAARGALKRGGLRIGPYIMNIYFIARGMCDFTLINGMVAHANSAAWRKFYGRPEGGNESGVNFQKHKRCQYSTANNVRSQKYI